MCDDAFLVESGWRDDHDDGVEMVTNQRVRGKGAGSGSGFGSTRDANVRLLVAFGYVDWW